VEDVLPVAVSVAVAFVVTVLVGAITDSLMMSSSAATAIQAGGTGAIRTDITVTAITRTVIMDTAGTRTAMDTAGTVTTVAPVMDIAMEADQGISGVGDKPGYGSLKSPAC
jgi:stage V sporulation protein SpoVS